MDDETVTCITAEAGTGNASTQVHPDFKPVKDLQISDLPQGWRCREAFDVISHVSQRVVMIYIPRMSSERPASIFSESPHFGGTGFVYYVDRHIVKVRTNLHVIYNAEEAGLATVQFSVHVPGKRNARVVRLRGWDRHFCHNPCEDFSSFTCRPTRRLLRYLHVFRHVPVLWDAAFFASSSSSSSGDSEDSCCFAGTDGEYGAAVTTTTMAAASTAGEDDADDDDDDDDDADDASAPSLIYSRSGAKRSRVRGDDGVLHGGKRSPRTISWEIDDREMSLEGGCRTAEPRVGLSSGSTVDDVAARREAELRVWDCQEEGENGYVSDMDSPLAESWNQCRRPTLENGDYIAILSHPQGLEKCFSVGPAALYDPAEEEKQQNNFQKCRRISGMHAGHPAVHLLNDRFKVCKNRIYHAESTFGCSGAPVLLFKRSLRRIRIPVVDYSQHSGTCFFKNGEKLGFATCFTPAVFSRSALACSQDLQQCYSVVRKQERLSRQEEKLHSKRFETPGSCAAESTHIVNADRARGRSGCLYRVRRGAIVRKRMRSSEDASQPGEPPVPSLLPGSVSAGAMRAPTQFRHPACRSRVDVQAERRGEGKSGCTPEQESDSLGWVCPWEERNSVSGCASAYLADSNFEDTRGTRCGDAVETESVSCPSTRQQALDPRLHILERLNSSNRCLQGLQSRSGYRIHRKKSGRLSTLTFRARKIGADKNHEEWVSTQKQKVLTESGHKSVDQETWEEDSPLPGCFSNPTVSSDESESGLSSGSYEKVQLDGNNLPIENADTNFGFSASSTDSDDSAREDSDDSAREDCSTATGGAHTEENISTLPHLGPSDCSKVSEVLKHENETALKAGHVDRTCISQQGTYCNTVNQLSVYSHLKHTLTEDSGFSCDSALSPSPPTASCVVDKNAQNQTSSNLPDVRHPGSSGKETDTHFPASDSDWESSPLPHHKIVDDFASDIKEHHHPVSENGSEHNSELFFIPVDRIHNILSLACSETSDNPQQWNILNTEIASDGSVNADGPSEPTSSHSIPDQPESLSKNPISPATTERAEASISEAAQVLHDQPIGDYVSFTRSSVDRFDGAEVEQAVDGTDQDHLSKSTLKVVKAVHGTDQDHLSKSALMVVKAMNSADQDHLSKSALIVKAMNGTDQDHLSKSALMVVKAMNSADQDHLSKSTLKIVKAMNSADQDHLAKSALMVVKAMNGTDQDHLSKSTLTKVKAVNRTDQDYLSKSTLKIVKAMNSADQDHLSKSTLKVVKAMNSADQDHLSKSTLTKVKAVNRTDQDYLSKSTLKVVKTVVGTDQDHLSKSTLTKFKAVNRTDQDYLSKSTLKVVKAMNSADQDHLSKSTLKVMEAVNGTDQDHLSQSTLTKVKTVYDTDQDHLSKLTLKVVKAMNSADQDHLSKSTLKVMEAVNGTDQDHLSQSTLTKVKTVYDTDQDYLSKLTLKAYLELIKDRPFHRAPSCPADSNVGNSDESPVGKQSKTNTDHESLLRDQTISEQVYQSGIREQPGEEQYMERQFGGSAAKSLLVERGDGDLRAAQITALHEGRSQNASFSEKGPGSLSPEKKFDCRFQQGVSEDTTLSGKLESVDVESDSTEGSYHSLLELPRPRSAYSLHHLKVLEHTRKNMREKVQEEISQLATEERSNNDARENRTSLGMQEMADRFLKMKSPTIDSSTGQNSRYMHLNNIKHFLSEIRNKLVPNGDRMSSQFLDQLWTPEHQTHAPPSSRGLATANQICVPSVDTKGSNLTVYPFARRTDLPYEQRYKYVPLFVHRKPVPASEEIVDNAIENDSYAYSSSLRMKKHQDEDCNAFRSTRTAFDPVVGSHKNARQGLNSGLSVHPHTAQPTIQPRVKPAAYSYFTPAVPKPSPDAHLKSRPPRYGDTHGDLYRAQPWPWLCGPADNMTGSPSAPVHTQGVDNRSPWATHLPRSGMGFDAGAFDRGEAVNSSRLKSAEPPLRVPRVSGVWPGYTRVLARNSSGFSEKSATADRDIFRCPDLASASTSSPQYGIASHGCLLKNAELSQRYQMCASNARDKIPANAISSHQQWLPRKGLNLGQRDGCPGNPPGWALVQVDPVWGSQYGPSKLGSTHKQHGDAFRRYHLEQTGNRSSHSLPKTRPDESGFRHDPFPFSLSAADLLTTERPTMKDGGVAHEYVHYQHEFARFAGSLGSSPGVPSSTDSSSFHSSPELPLSETDTVPEPGEQLTFSAPVPDLLTPWSSSRRAESQSTSVPARAAPCNPVKWKAGCAHHGLADTPRKLEARRNVSSVSMMKRNRTKTTVPPSLSKAFERFLSSDVEDDDSLDSEEGECWWEDGTRSRPTPWTSSFPVRSSREQARSAGDLLWVDTAEQARSAGDLLWVDTAEQARSAGDLLWVDTAEQARSAGDLLWVDTADACHRPAHGLSEFSGFSGTADSEAARYSPLLKLLTDISPQRTTDLESGFRSESTLSTAFNRFFELHLEGGSEVPTAQNSNCSSSETRKSLPNSSEPSASSADRDWQSDKHVYDVDDIEHVVLEMGVMRHEAPPDSTGPVSPDDPQCNVYEPPTEMFSSSAYKCSSTTRNDDYNAGKPHPKADSTCPSQEKTRKGKPRLQKQNDGVKPLQVVKTLQTEIIDMGYSSSTGECSDDCVPRPKARQKTRHHERHRAISDLRGKSASGSTHTSQQSTESSSALRGNLPRKKRQADHVSRKRSVLSLHSALHRESRLYECKSSTLHQTAWRPDGAEEPGLSDNPQWQPFSAKQPCCQDVSPPLGWTWNDNGPYAPLCGCRCCALRQFRHPPPGCHPPFLQQPPPCLHGPGDQRGACPKGSEPSSKPLDNCRLDRVGPNGSEACCGEYACIPTADVMDVAFRATLLDAGIIRAQFSQDSEEHDDDDSVAKARMAPKSSDGAADPQREHEHGSSGAASKAGGKYVKNRKTKRSGGKANRYSRRGRDNAGDKDPAARQKPRSVPRPPGDDGKREASSDGSATSLAQDLARVLRCGQLSNDSGSEKSRHGVHYVTVPGDIRVRLEKAAKWIATQMFVCPQVHFLTPRDAGVFARQQNLHLTLHTMTLFD